MKKEYISPKVIAREIKLHNLMAGSVPMTEEDTDPGLGSDAKGGFTDFDVEEDYYTKKSLW